MPTLSGMVPVSHSRRKAAVQWVLFDVEGTLLELRDPLRWAACAELAGLPSDPDAIAHFYDEIWRADDDALGGTADEEFWRAVFEGVGSKPPDRSRLVRFLELLRSEPVPPQAFSDVIWCLAEIGRRGIRAGVASTDGPEGRMRSLLAAAGLEGRFQFVEAPDAGIVPSGDPGWLERAVGRTGTAPASTVYVGARPNRGVRAARAAGIPAVWLHRQGTGFGEDLPEITSLSELPGAVAAGVRLK